MEANKDDTQRNASPNNGHDPRQAGKGSFTIRRGKEKENMLQDKRQVRDFFVSLS